MKRTCNGCRALEMGQGYHKCVLGYKYDDKFKPSEECPKPRTICDLIYWQRYAKRNSK